LFKYTNLNLNQTRGREFQVPVQRKQFKKK